MLLMQSPAEGGWVFADVENQCHYIGAVYPAAKGMCQFVIGKLSNSYYEAFLALDYEVYQTTFFAINALDFAQNIALAFTFSEYAENPVEMVYKFGGTIKGRVPDVILGKVSAPC